MNHIVIMGRLTRDPVLRQTTTGTPVASFTLAVDRPFTPKDGGERQTDFIDVVAWRNTAEFVSKHFVKGQMCAVAGRLQIRDWTDNDGNKRRNAEVVADNVYFTGDRRERDGAPQNRYDRQQDGYGGGSYQPQGGRGYEQPPAARGFGASSAPPREGGYDANAPQDGYSQPSGFSELDDDDDLPF